MNPSPIHTGTVDHGRVRLDNPERYAVAKSFLEGRRVELVLRRQRSQRSLQQNRAYWGIAVEILSEHLGYDKNEVHFNLKEKFATSVDPRTGLKRVESTAKMDTKRFIQYYEDIQRWASEFLGVYVPSPNECEPNL